MSVGELFSIRLIAKLNPLRAGWVGDRVIPLYSVINGYITTVFRLVSQINPVHLDASRGNSSLSGGSHIIRYPIRKDIELRRWAQTVTYTVFRSYSELINCAS